MRPDIVMPRVGLFLQSTTLRLNLDYELANTRKWNQGRGDMGILRRAMHTYICVVAHGPFMPSNCTLNLYQSLPTHIEG